MHAEQGGLQPLGLGRDHGRGARTGGHDIADPRRHRLVDDAGRAEPAVLDRLLAGRHPGVLAEHLSPGREDVGGGAGRGVHVPGARLAAEQRHPVAEHRGRAVSVHVDPVVGPDVDHAMVGGDVQRSPRRQGRGELLHQPVHVRELELPGLGGHPVHMPGRVQVAVVGRHQGGVGLGQGLGRQRGQRAERVGALELRAAQRGYAQAGLLVAPGGDVGRAHPGREGPLEDRRPRLPLDRVDVLGPVQAVQQPAGAGDRDLVAEHPVGGRRQTRAERAQAGHRGGGEPGRQRPGVERQLGQERGRGLVRTQQLEAEPVDDQQAGPAGLGQAEHVA